MAKAVISTTAFQEPSAQPQRWNLQEFKDALGDKGYSVTHEVAMSCPCRINANKQALSSCVNCGGTGYFYINKVETRMICHSMGSTNRQEVWTRELDRKSTRLNSSH